MVATFAYFFVFVFVVIVVLATVLHSDVLDLLEMLENKGAEKKNTFNHCCSDCVVALITHTRSMLSHRVTGKSIIFMY